MISFVHPFFKVSVSAETLSADGCGPYDATGKMLTDIHGSQIRKQNMSTCVRTISLQANNGKTHPDYAPSILCRTADFPETQRATQSLKRFTTALNRTLACSMGSKTTSAALTPSTTMICTPKFG